MKFQDVSLLQVYLHTRRETADANRKSIRAGADVPAAAVPVAIVVVDGTFVAVVGVVVGFGAAVVDPMISSHFL